MASDLRFEDDADTAPGFSLLVKGVLELDGYPEDFFHDAAREKVSEKLKGILANSGRRTGADAQITPKSISMAAAIQSGYAYHV